MFLELLETRRLLSASVVGNGVMVVKLDDSGGNVIIQETAAGNTATVTDANSGTTSNFAGVKAIVVLGGAGADNIIAIAQNVPLFIDGAGGNDNILVQVNPFDSNGVFHSAYVCSGSLILGGNDNDTIIVAGVSNSTVLGGNGDDTIIAGAEQANSVAGSFNAGGNDMLIDGGNNNDSLSSGFESDGFVVLPGLTDSTVLGGNGNDTITDIGSGNTVNGGNGADAITVTGGDIVVHSTGADTVVVV